MSIEHLIAFNLALFAAMASPGPALLLSIQTSLRSGRRAGVATGLGLATMAATWTTMALLGLEAIFRLVPWAYALMKIIGAAYLLYIAWGMWRGAGDPIEAGPKPTRHAFLQGFLINALNPKAVLFAAAVLVVIMPQNMTMLGNAIIVANHLVIEVIFYSSVAFSMSTETARNGYLRAKRIIDRSASVVLGALGIRLLISR